MENTGPPERCTATTAVRRATANQRSTPATSARMMRVTLLPVLRRAGSTFITPTSSSCAAAVC
jgi:hypothetical protein